MKLEHLKGYHINGLGQKEKVMLATNQKQFNLARYYSKPPEVRTLLDMTQDDDPRIALGYTLARKFILDKEIDIYGWDPWTVTRVRIAQGYTWYPSALQNPLLVAPGLNDQHDPPYDPNHPPAGSLIMSIDLADYPVFGDLTVKPVSTDPIMLYSPVGNFLHPDPILGDAYGNKAWDKWADKSTTGVNGVPADSRGVFVKEMIPSPFYSAAVWHLKK